MKRIVAFVALTIAVAFPALASGPTGIGALKIGMSKEAVEALQRSDGVYLSGPLTPRQDKYYTPKPGEDEFETYIGTPLSTESLEATLTFRGGKLESIEISLGGTAEIFEQVMAQITEKYGPGKVDDKIKGKQCIYTNGANYKNGATFKKISGNVVTKWIEDLPGSVQIETRLLHDLFDTCPSDLRYSSTRIELRYLNFRKINKSIAEEPKNLF